MDCECYSFKLMCPPVKVHNVMLGTADQTGHRLIHYTFLSAQITLPEHNHRLPVCVAWPRWNKTENRGMEMEREGGNKRGTETVKSIGIFRFTLANRGFICEMVLFQPLDRWKNPYWAGEHSMMRGSIAKALRTSRAPSGPLDCDT